MFNEKEIIEKILDKAIKINTPDKNTIFIEISIFGHTETKQVRLDYYKNGWQNDRKATMTIIAESLYKNYQEKLEEILKFLENLEEKENDTNRK